MITKLFNLKCPIIQGGMARISNSELVAAVSQSGALGTLTSYGRTPVELRQEIKNVKDKTCNVFACNLMMQQSNVEALVEVIIEENVPIVSVSAGFKSDIIHRLQENHIKVIAVVGSKKQAEKVISAGVDCLVAEGSEAGGHIGEVPLEILLSEILPITNLPVVAAGGIADGDSIEKHLQNGAAGIQVGTLFLISQESSLPQTSKVLLAKEVSETKVILTEQQLKLRIATTKKTCIPCGKGINKVTKIASVSEILADLGLVK
ncbi:NAD(P)H-dependent flavin oxidoreductase [Enterococcus sp. DIV1420a]|uniref:NAD(P)H-dependent flavin oxidoreductase n=1 Tax=Enterococcus TaxID=1350 RepID=UPI0036D45390